MAGMNKVIVCGNLGQDPEARDFQNGGQVVNLSIATSDVWKDKNTGEKRERTEWHRVAIFAEGAARVAREYLRKGDQVLIEGKLETRKWQDQSGQDRYSTEIVVRPYQGNVTLLRNDRSGGGGSRDDGPRGGGYGGPMNPPASGPGQQGGPTYGAQRDLDDEIPF